MHVLSRNFFVVILGWTLLFEAKVQCTRHPRETSVEEVSSLTKQNDLPPAKTQVHGHTTPFPHRRNHHPTFSPKGGRLSFLDDMLEGYDKRAWPTYGRNEPTEIKVNMHINSLGSINAANMEFSMDIYLRQSWLDPRLRVSRFGINRTVTLNGEDLMERIWKPDLFFRNVKSAAFHTVTVPNKLIKLAPNGEILFSMRLTLRLSCHMSFRQYPLDTQRCWVVVGPYAQTMDQVVIKWQNPNPITLEQELELPEFDMEMRSPGGFQRIMDTGSFSFLNVSFILVRQNGYHLVQTYLPTFLIVMISWVSFWLNVDATPARVTLGVTTLLTLTTVASGVRTQLPPVSYVKAIDVWIGACSVMVFGALLEFTLVNYLSRSKLTPRQMKYFMRYLRPQAACSSKPEKSNVSTQEEDLPDENGKMNDKSGPEDSDEVRVYNEARARTVDRVCRVLFPLAFLVFNIAYWTYYLYLS